ncbi:kinesin-domain-containing protein [Neolentinus lepideus HHB14362 ss-1]|uniref:Kinesin-domain-containing protein n=1 Tax=Neolentinus lepideus HHB14362 ss-1 TaxID=1314782 RepID=A0A165TGA3_9AGAM|nr:kinesin-domain-containing protein [Neolentinus lepideus HHB14362 ss-1]
MAPSSATTTSIQVAVRIRPTTTQDTTSIPARFQRAVVHPISETTVAVDPVSAQPASAGASTGASASSTTSQKKQTFTFDQVHPPATNQHALFTSTAEPLLNRFLEGFNCTILAYGQTSSGKTFTMTGIDLDADPSNPNNGMGIIPRAVSTIFKRARALKEERGNSWNFTIKGSYIEIYNEDLLDLLASDDGTGARREVQIREDKGHIIWSGLREVTVKNAAEVMALIRQGASIRRTNETDMNAQSSRSHAIFSLTLTQKKFTGSGPPPRSSSPLPPSGRSPSRLARPGSMYAPASARVSSPTFGRPGTPSFSTAMDRGGLRPPSSLGSHNDDGGEWVTITSKFHFVDLAGSERLKRTAAAGERVKEGISINSGLLALGNVISALGDPARAKTNTATHVPYRDSKLTRLLQDSLGGNAHTLMIACVSPAEWNAGETINTLKYANRARNIKNRVTLNEKEEGWDDVEWLQTTVTRLRKELKVIKEGGGKSVGTVSADGAHELVVEGASKKVLEQMVQLQSNYEDLREKFTDRTEELTRLRRELAEKQRQSSGTMNATARYEEIVGPVIEEYEKTISAMEADLSLNRAALRHTNDLYEEKEAELAEVSEKSQRTELYVEELRLRVAKLTEREAYTEAYVRDLEDKIKHFDETTVSSSESLTDLKKEITRYKDAESHTTEYIADLEARLARSDESIQKLRKQVDNLETECERRSQEVEVLQSRLECLKNDGQAWRDDVEEREKRVKELELKMQEWEAKKKEAGEERARLGNMVDEVARARQSLQLDGTSAAAAAATNGTHIEDESPEGQLAVLQKTHAQTLADLSSVTNKYRDALREISDLAAQIQEAKLSNAAPADPPERSMEIPPFRRRKSARSRQASDSQYIPASGKRFLFRNAASSESLHSRSLSQSPSQSQSLSQELFLVQSRKASISSQGSSGSVSHSPSHSHTLSRPNLSISLPSNGLVSPNTGERSVQSLEKEIMRLQEVLKEREAEIAHLEGSLQVKDEKNSSNESNGPPEEQTIANPDLSPKTMHNFNVIRQSFQNGVNGHVRADSMSASDTDESLERLNELMRSMAQKESQHRETVESINSELAQVRRQCDELTALSRDQALNMSTELAALHEKHDQNIVLLEQTHQREAELEEKLKETASDHEAAVEHLRVEHEQALQAKAQELEAILTRLKEEHEVSVSALREQLSEVSSALEKARDEHTEAFGKLRSEHEEELRRRIDEANEVLQRAQQEHESALAKAAALQEEALKKKDEEAAAALAHTEEEYYNALSKLRADHAQALEKQTADSSATLERLQDEHASEIRQLEITYRGTISESQSSLDTAMVELKQEFADLTSKKEAAFSEQLAKAEAERNNTLSAMEQEHNATLDKLRLEHAAALEDLQRRLASETETLKDQLSESQQQSQESLTRAREEFDAALASLKEQHVAVLQEVERGHESDIAKIKTDHEATFADAKVATEQERTSLMQSHTEEMAKIRSEHQKVMAEAQANLVAAEDLHKQALDEARSQSERLLEDEKSRFQSLLREAEEKHNQERDTSRKDHALLLEELASYKAASEEYKLAREETRKLHEDAVGKKDEEISRLGGLLSESHNEQEQLKSELEQLRAELATTRNQQSTLIKEASKRQSLVDELERHRSELADAQETLQRTRDERDQLMAEKTRQDAVVKDLQAQLLQSNSAPDTPSRPFGERSISYTRNGLPPPKLPPSNPPPSIPPPPLPVLKSVSEHGFTASSHSSAITTASSRESGLDSPNTSLANSSFDVNLATKVEEQSKHIEEQEAMIKTLNKQLTHCETDLQTHMDMVGRLETSLGDSEKNLRKARMHATELARERDTLNSRIEGLQRELTDAKREVVNVRRSVVEEKQSLESRLDEERRAKERARAQLDSRMEELQRRKSKFACL